MCSVSWCAAFLVSIFSKMGPLLALDMHRQSLRNTLLKKKTPSKWHLASESGIVNCHNKSKKGTWQVNIKKVVALATSLQRITKTTLAWTFGAALHQPHHPSPQRKFTQWAMINAQQSESVQLLPRPCDLICTLCGCPTPSWPMTHLIPQTTC